MNQFGKFLILALVAFGPAVAAIGDERNLRRNKKTIIKRKKGGPSKQSVGLKAFKGKGGMRKASFDKAGWYKSKFADLLKETPDQKKKRCKKAKDDKKLAKKKRKAAKGLMKKRNKKNRKKDKKAKSGLEIVGGKCVADHFCAEVRGDPHITTYDGMKYDCQGHGEFVLAKSLDSAFEIQGRFSRTKRTDKSVSITKAISIDTGVEDAPQLDLFTEDVDGTCIINWYVNGVLVDGFGPDGTDYTGIEFMADVDGGKDNMDYVYFTQSGIMYSVYAKQGSFGCVLNSKICLPPDMVNSEKIIGLLGTPNNDSTDDWVSAFGTQIPYGSSTKWASAYNYCTREHCVHTADESIFGYEPNTEWADFYGCKDSYDSGAEDAVDNASQECVDCCSVLDDADGNFACLVECTEGGTASCIAEIQTEEVLKDAEKKCPDSKTTSGGGGTPKSGGTLKSAPIKEKSGPAPDDDDDGTKSGGGFAQNTCSLPMWVPQDNSDSPTGMVRCCAGQHGKDGEEYGKCDTSSCRNNFNGKDRNCFNYGAPQNGGKGKKPNQGSAICPYADSDHAICDTSFYDDLNDVSCRLNPNGKNFQVHCLGKVKCNTKGVTVPKNGHSDGTADYDDSGETECLGAAEGFKAGQDCFYDGASENWKVCDPDDETPPTPDRLTPQDFKAKEAFTKGDPHFKTFGGELYDYHGECDLVLLHNPDFKEGLGMDIHIRTKIEAFWSSVESAAIKLGDEIMEIKADPLSNEWLWFNGQEVTSTLKDGEWNARQLSGFKVRFKQTNTNVREANIYLKGSAANEVLVMKTFKSFVRVDVNWQGSSHYFNSVGLLGSHAHEGKRLGRDGEFIEDFNAFGQEWQVRPEVDGSLFHSYEGAVVGKKCVMPPKYHKGDNISAAVHRRLGASALDEEQAEKACNHLVDPEEKRACVYDVIATQDLNMASAW